MADEAESQYGQRGRLAAFPTRRSWPISSMSNEAELQHGRRGGVAAWPARPSVAEWQHGKLGQIAAWLAWRSSNMACEAK